MKTKSFLIAILILYCSAGLSFYATAAPKGLAINDVDYLTGNEFVQLHFKIDKMIPIPDVFYPDKNNSTHIVMRVNNVAVELGKKKLTFDSPIIDNVKVDPTPNFTDVHIHLVKEANYRVFTNQKGLYIEFPKSKNVLAANKDTLDKSKKSEVKPTVVPERNKIDLNKAQKGSVKKEEKMPASQKLNQAKVNKTETIKKEPPVKSENLNLKPVSSSVPSGGVSRNSISNSNRSAVIKDVVIRRKEGGIVKFDVLMSNAPDYSVIPIKESPSRLAIDFKNTHSRRIKKVINHLNVKQIRGAYNSATVYRMVFDLDYLDLYKVAPRPGKPNVLEIAFFKTSKDKDKYARNKRNQIERFEDKSEDKQVLAKANNIGNSSKKAPAKSNLDNKKDLSGNKNVSKGKSENLSKQNPTRKNEKLEAKNSKSGPAAVNTIQLGEPTANPSPGIVVTRNEEGVLQVSDIRPEDNIKVSERSIKRDSAPGKQVSSPASQSVSVENTTTQSKIANDFFGDEKSQVMPENTISENPQDPTNAGNDPSRQLTYINQTIATGEKQYFGEKMTFNFHNADLKDVIKFISKISGLNIILDPGVGGRVTAQLDQVPWDQALELFLKINSLDMIQEGNILRIGNVDKLANEAEKRRRLRDARQEAKDLTVFTKTLSFAKVSEVSAILRKQLSKRGEILTDNRTNTLIISEIPDKIEEMKRLLEVLDTANPQVSIEARIVETNSNFIESFGIQWGYGFVADAAHGNQTTLKFPNNFLAAGNQFLSDSSPLLGPLGGYAVNLPASGATSGTVFSLGNVANTLRLDMALSAMQTRGKGRIISAPKTTTQNNQEAAIAQGRLIPVQTIQNNTITVIYRPASLELKVKPQITAEGAIVMEVDLKNDAPDFANLVNGIPPITTQTIKTTVMVTDGGTVVIGGMYKIEKTVTKNGVPVISKIPILGNLFKSSTKRNEQRELLIFITPRIIK
jgi:type IV pilus assembly protein PilQ